MDDNVDENDLVGNGLDGQPVAITDDASPESEPGEIIQLLKYPENVVDQPEAAKMLTAALQSKSKMDKYKKDFFNTVCSLVGLEVGDSPTTHLNDIYQRCMTIYSKLLENNGAALLANTIGIFVHLPGGGFPSDVLKFLLSFLTKGFNLETRTASKALKVVSSEAETSVLMRGKVVWDTFMDTKKTVNNVHNPLYREPKSGENLAGVLLQIRMTLHKENAKDLEKSRLLRVSRTMPEFVGFAKNKVISNARMACNSAKFLDFNYAGFEDDWYPAVWMIFFLCGLPAGSNSLATFDPEKRAKKTINDHLESVRSLALSRDGRREASRSVGLADSAAKKGTNFTTPSKNTSLVNIIQHTAPSLTVIQELEKSIKFFTTYGPPEALQRAVLELGEVYERNSRNRRIEE